MKTLKWVLQEFAVIILFACIFYVAMSLFHIQQDTVSILVEVQEITDYCFK